MDINALIQSSWIEEYPFKINVIDPFIYLICKIPKYNPIKKELNLLMIPSVGAVPQFLHEMAHGLDMTLRAPNRLNLVDYGFNDKMTEKSLTSTITTELRVTRIQRLLLEDLCPDLQYEQQPLEALIAELYNKISAPIKPIDYYIDLAKTIREQNKDLFSISEIKALWKTNLEIIKK